MKLDKNQQKELLSLIHEFSKKNGYKVKSNTFFTLKGSAFAFCDFLIVNSQKIIYRLYIKDYDYDNIFWKIIRMEENIKKNDSLRACGAFKAPAVLLTSGEIDIMTEYEKQAKQFADMIDKCACEFIKSHNIDEYVIKNEDGMNADLLKCLAFFHMNQKDKAVKIAQSAIRDTKPSGYENNGKTFWEWVLLTN